MGEKRTQKEKHGFFLPSWRQVACRHLRLSMPSEVVKCNKRKTKLQQQEVESPRCSPFVREDEMEDRRTC